MHGQSFLTPADSLNKNRAIGVTATGASLWVGSTLALQYVWYSDFEKYHEMKDKGVHLQLNILSLLGHYSPETRKIAERMVDENLITFLGSDCHNLGHQHLINIARTKKYVHKLLDSGLLKNTELM